MVIVGGKGLIKGSQLRLLVLRKLRDVWEMYPDQKGLVETQSIWDPIWKKVKNRITSELGTAVFASLKQDGYVEFKVIEKDRTKVSLARITDKGLEYLSEFEKATLTRRIALLGAMTGCLGLVIAIISLILKMAS